MILKKPPPLVGDTYFSPGYDKQKEAVDEQPAAPAMMR